MHEPDQATRVIRFGVFEVDLHTTELRKQGVRIRLPLQSFQVLEALLRQPGELGSPFAIPTALDNMDSSNPFVQTLSGLPIAKGVHAHSIIAVTGNGPPEEGNDGVVEYKSAHIEGVESELVVRSGHSTQANPETIEEVRRILYEHANIH